MSEGTRSGSTVVPCSLDEDATIEPIGSGSLASRRASTWPPMARSTSTKAVRVGESRTPSRRTSESGRTRAATTRKAALEASPGTRTSAPRRRAPPRTVAARPARSTLTPKAGSIRSVWSRLGAGSRTVVEPSACRPARRIAVFTCALATGSSCVMPRRRPPSIGHRGLAVGGENGGAHRAQRGGHALEGPSPQRLVAGEHRAERPPGEGAREHADRRARVLGVEDGGGRAPGVEAAAVDRHLGPVPRDRDAERLAGRRGSRRSPRPRSSCGHECGPRPSRPGSPPGARWTCRRGG